MLYALKPWVSVPACLYLLILLGGLLAWRGRRRAARWIAGIGFGLLLLLSSPWCSAALLRSLQPDAGIGTGAGSQGRSPWEEPGGSRAQAIVILSADAASLAPEYGGATVGRLTLERLRYGAHVARRTDLPVLVAGGSSRPEIASRAELMARVLEDEFGVPVAYREESSADTWGNATGAWELLGGVGLRRVLLVTHAWHMPRASLAFEAAGFEVLPAPTAFRDWPEPRLASLVPSARSLQESAWAVHEWLGRAFYLLRRR